MGERPSKEIHSYPQTPPSAICSRTLWVKLLLSNDPKSRIDMKNAKIFWSTCPKCTQSMCKKSSENLQVIATPVDIVNTTQITMLFGFSHAVTIPIGWPFSLFTKACFLSCGLYCIVAEACGWSDGSYAAVASKYQGESWCLMKAFSQKKTVYCWSWRSLFSTVDVSYLLLVGMSPFICLPTLLAVVRLDVGGCLCLLPVLFFPCVSIKIYHAFV